MKNNSKAHSFFYRNGLTIVFFSLFLITLFAQAFTGWKTHNQDLIDDGAKAISMTIYLQSGHFISSTFENFESEFLQMGLYVVLTIGLRQIGSAESKSLDKEEDVDREPVASKKAPWAVKKGGWILAVYKNSLSICFLLLFLISWSLHFYGSWMDYNVEEILKGHAHVSMFNYLGDANFWFESFQNWQSEFLSVASIVFLTIYLRQKGSPESKPVDTPDFETGK